MGSEDFGRSKGRWRSARIREVENLRTSIEDVDESLNLIGI